MLLIHHYIFISYTKEHFPHVKVIVRFGSNWIDLFFQKFKSYDRNEFDFEVELILNEKNVKFMTMKF